MNKETLQRAYLLQTKLEGIVNMLKHELIPYVAYLTNDGNLYEIKDVSFSQNHVHFRYSSYSGNLVFNHSVSFDYFNDPKKYITKEIHKSTTE